METFEDHNTLVTHQRAPEPCPLHEWVVPEGCSDEQKEKIRRGDKVCRQIPHPRFRPRRPRRPPLSYSLFPRSRASALYAIPLLTDSHARAQGDEGSKWRRMFRILFPDVEQDAIPDDLVYESPAYLAAPIDPSLNLEGWQGETSQDQQGAV